MKEGVVMMLLGVALTVLLYGLGHATRQAISEMRKIRQAMGRHTDHATADEMIVTRGMMRGQAEAAIRQLARIGDKLDQLVAELRK